MLRHQPAQPSESSIIYHRYSSAPLHLLHKLQTMRVAPRNREIACGVSSADLRKAEIALVNDLPACDREAGDSEMRRRSTDNHTVQGKRTGDNATLDDGCGKNNGVSAFLNEVYILVREREIHSHLRIRLEPPARWRCQKPRGIRLVYGSNHPRWLGKLGLLTCLFAQISTASAMETVFSSRVER